MYPLGQHIDRFIAGDRPGAVLVQAGGNAFEDPGSDFGESCQFTQRAW
ncbi:MAG: hypothetical protein ACR2MN_08850 [Acidimicrobiales bacterium]